MNKKILIGGFAAVSAVLSLASPAFADPPAGTGFDTVPDVAIGGGSDTTYLVSQRLEVLYNGAPGCLIETGEVANKGQCKSHAGTDLTNLNGNYDHDVVVSATPTGSGSGVDALRVGGAGVTPGSLNQYTPAIDFARSSSGPGTSTRADQVTYWGYARDAIQVLTFGSRSNACITQQQLKDIYSNVITDWSSLKDCTGAALAAGPIIPWAMNSASGTNATFTSYISPVDPATNGRKLKATGAAPFENDIKPLLADPGPDNVLGNADDNENNYIWWISYGDWLTYPYTANGCSDGGAYSVATNTCATGTVISSNPVTIAGGFDGSGLPTGTENGLPNAATINGNTYPILRTLYHVTRNIDADCMQAVTTGTNSRGTTCDNVGSKVYGATSGKGGAVRQFTEWICRTSNATQAVNPVTGRGYRSEIVSALNLEGFQQVPAGLRTTGYACSVTT